VVIAGAIATTSRVCSLTRPVSDEHSVAEALARIGVGVNTDAIAGEMRAFRAKRD
jgi:hypothetical protein